MSNSTAIKLAITKRQASKFIKENNDLINHADIRQTVQNSLSKLNEVESRIDKIENKGFFKRMIGGFTGSNSRDMIAAMRNLGQAQQMTIQLVLSLAVMHTQNQKALDEILSELNESKGTYSRITEHIDFLYDQVTIVKESSKKLNHSVSKAKSVFIKVLAYIGIVILIVLVTKFFL